MKKYIAITACVLIVTAAVALIWADSRINALTAQRDKYKGNTETLLSDIEKYRVRDSLNAAQVQSLELSIKEYERFRADDARLIRDLKAKNRDLAAVNKTQSQTIIDLLAIPRDTLLIRDSVKIPAIALHCGDAWFDFDGLLTEKEFTGSLANRDSLVVAETVKYKRFLGFLWKTKEIKDRQVDVVSKNPHTNILNVEYVIITK